MNNNTDIFLIEISSDNDKIKSYQLSYEQLTGYIKTKFGLWGIQDNIRDISDDMYVRNMSATIYNTDDNIFIISALYENGRGVLQSLSTYELRSALSDIITNTEYSQLCAVDSPWIEISNITDDTGTASDKVASYSLISSLRLELSDYISTADIINNISDLSNQNLKVIS
jgi:hypothetical protein